MNISTFTLFATLTVTLTVLPISATQLTSSSGRSRTSNDVFGTQSDMEIWEEFSRWRRSHPRHGGRSDNRDYDNERERDNRRWDDGRDRRGRDPRDRPDGRNKDRNTGKPYPPAAPEPERPVVNPLPIIIEPIRPMPSIIEPYPIIEITTNFNYPVTSTMEEGHIHYSQTQSTDYYSSNIGTVSVSSVLYPSSTEVDAYTSKVTLVSRTYTPVSNTTSTSITYGSTSIITVPESTVTTKITGRYRAMSNSASGVGSSIAGSISFGLVLFSSLFLLIVV